MSSYRLTLFGSPLLQKNGRTLHLPRRKARALLAYLAVSQQSYSRETLVALLWPNYNAADGRADLSRTLSLLRKKLGAETILADRESVELNPQADLWLDVTEFRQKIEDCLNTAIPLNNTRLQTLSAATDLYCADFLAGFTLPDSPDFDEWQLLQTESLRLELAQALTQLAQAYSAQNQLPPAISTAQRLVALDPLHEPAQRQLIELYLHSDQRAEAHRQYQTLVQLLADELGVDPQPDTEQLYEQIRHGRTPTNPLTLPPQPSPALPAFLAEDADEEPPEGGHFVARQAELARLQAGLDEMMNGNGRVLFISGGAGRGKTSLLNEFTRRAQAQHPDLIVAGGVCNAYAGVGDPYLPFRELLSLLTGDVEARLKAKAMTRDQARRLWQITPRTLELLLAQAPHLLDVFVGGKALLSRAETAVPHTPTLSQLQQLLANPRPAGLEQSGLFSEYTDLLRTLAEEQPLLLTLDDLHWADEASLGLLFHLSRRLQGSRLLIIGSHRPDELVHGRDQQPHPLQKVLAELQRHFGDININLAAADHSDGRVFIDALLDSEPNHLSQPFRQALLRQTGGHPLFTVELLREMQNSGSLIQDEASQWQEAGHVNWAAMPTRVEAVIAQRLARLDEPLRDLLRLASVEGERFTVEVIAHITGLSRRELVERFSRDLVKQQRLLIAQGIERLDGGQTLSRYRFQHHLFQTYLYHSQDEIERVYQHEAIGNALETLYGDQVGEIGAQCARHFEEAGLLSKAIAYLWRASERAMRLSAFEEAVESGQRGLTLAASLPQTNTTIRQKIDLLQTLGEANRKAGQYEESLATFQQAAQIAREHNLPQELARAALGYEESRWRFNLPPAPAILLLEEALAALGQPESFLKGRVWVNLVRTRMAVISPEQFTLLTQQALEMARRLNDPVALFDALYLIVRGDRRPEKSAERLAMMAEMRQLSQKLGDRERLYDVYGFRLQEFMEMGDMASFQKDDAIVAPLAKKLRQPFYNYYPSISRVTLAVFDGRLAEAEKLAQESLEIGRQMGVDNVDGIYGMQMFSIRREQGRLPEMAALIRLLVQQNAAAAWRPGLALIYSELDMRSEAAQEFERLAADTFAAIPQDAMWITSMTYMAEVCAYLADRERAAVLYELLLPYDGRAAVVGFLSFCYGAVARYLGLLATTLQRWPQAEHHFESALEMNGRMGARPWLAHTQHQYALMLLARNQKNDADKAISLLNEALTAAQEFGMQALESKINHIGERST